MLRFGLEAFSVSRQAINGCFTQKLVRRTTFKISNNLPSFLHGIIQKLHHKHMFHFQCSITFGSINDTIIMTSYFSFFRVKGEKLPLP